mmetsp:Transcript_102012/g.233649  ORF Transcript_102012/g.233649 Transcript_102012/m.233649 type:complete len:108 (+) Transcript_102012:24-347(+)
MFRDRSEGLGPLHPHRTRAHKLFPQDNFLKTGTAGKSFFATNSALAVVIAGTVRALGREQHEEQPPQQRGGESGKSPQHSERSCRGKIPECRLAAQPNLHEDEPEHL